MDQNTKKIRHDIVATLMPDVAFDGWSWAGARQAAIGAGYTPDMADAVFPAKLDDVVADFAALADQAMLDALSDIDSADLKIRARIIRAVEARLTFLAQYKEAERQAVAYWMRPMRKYKGANIVWRTADEIWRWAGDTATDYNYYTKRTLLSGVLSATTLYWLGRQGDDLAPVFAFLRRRVDNVLTIGKSIAPAQSRLAVLKGFLTRKGAA